MSCRRAAEALEAIDAAIEHTPSIADLYLCKARLLRNAGDTAAAWQLADEARKMDLADRYLNSECTKIMLQADEVDKAHEVHSPCSPLCSTFQMKPTLQRQWQAPPCCTATGA